ncbi:P-loop containing nucleoside triphosphate hydrolase protein, partial [Chytriomyces sp. MP71]
MTWIETLDKHLARLHPTQRARVSTHVLHSQTPREQLDRAFVPAHANMLKIVLSTNIAESSVTISDVSCVIDHGLRRALEYNSAMGCQMLKLGWISRASSTQRS